MKLLLYDDNPDFGGHQAMALRGIEALAADPSIEVECMINPANNKLVERLREAGIPAYPAQTSLPEADLMLCIQGDLAQSAKGLKAARKAGIECISYIALPHTLTEMGAKLGTLRDRLNQHLLNLPTRYIVISEGMASLLRARGVSQPIAIVQNGIPVPCPLLPVPCPLSSVPCPPLSPAPCPLPQERLAVLGMLGRIEFSQKRQDFMVRTFRDFPQAFQNCRLLIAGDGPDQPRLERLVATTPCNSAISLLPWQKEIDAFFASIDVLTIPSRYEGVPLVMLEAIARGIPVIASRRDGMKEILPEAWTFEPGSAAALAETFARVRDTWQTDIGPLREKILAEHSLETFKANFVKSVAS